MFCPLVFLWMQIKLQQTYWTRGGPNKMCSLAQLHKVYVKRLQCVCVCIYLHFNANKLIYLVHSSCLTYVLMKTNVRLWLMWLKTVKCLSLPNILLQLHWLTSNAAKDQFQEKFISYGLITAKKNNSQTLEKSRGVNSEAVAFRNNRYSTSGNLVSIPHLIGKRSYSNFVSP